MDAFKRITPIILASIFASVFSPTELFYSRADALTVASSTVTEIPWIASPLAAQELATTEEEEPRKDAERPRGEPETLKEMSDRISKEYAPGEPLATLRNLVWTESRWDPDAKNSGGDRGLVQINKWYHPEVSDSEAYDPEWALIFAAKAIDKGRETQWVACNCYLYLKTRIKALPLMADIVPNSTPKVGAVAIFWYKEKYTAKWVKHVALIEKLSATGFTVAETNFTKCLFDRRVIAWDDERLEGFWSP